MKKSLLLFLGTLLILGVQKCTLDSPNKADFPSWLVEINLPLFEKTFHADSLIDDSSLVKQQYGDETLFAFQDTSQKIERREVGKRLEIGDIQNSFRQTIADISINNTSKTFSKGIEQVGIQPVSDQTTKELGEVTLSNTSSTSDPINFSDIYPAIENIPGDSATIPEDTKFDTIYKEINLTNFQRATFADGEIVITINNNTVAEMGRPITVQLCQDNPDTTEIPGLAASWVDNGNQGIMPGEKDSRSIDLSEQNLTGNLIIKISGVLCGSGPQIVNKDSALASSFNVEMETRSLTVTSATGDFPSQEITQSGTVALAESDNKLKEAKIHSGNLNIFVTNQLETDIILHFSIPNLIDSQGNPFHNEIEINKNTDDFSHSTTIDGFSITMEIDDQSIDYEYTIETVETGEMQTFNSDDSVAVGISLTGQNRNENLTIAELTGIISQEPVIKEGSIAIASNQAAVKNAVISTGNLDILVENHITKQQSQSQPKLEIQIPEILDENNSPLHIGPINLNNGSNSVSINNQQNSLANYQLKPQNYQNDEPQSLSYNAIVTIPDEQIGSYDFLDSLDFNINISELKFKEVTGKFNQQPIIKRDSIKISEPHKLESAEISSGNLFINFQNNIGAKAEVQFSLPNIISKKNGDQFSSVINLTEAGENNKNINLADYNLALNVKGPDSAQYISYSSRINIPSNEEMTLDFNKEINTEIALKEVKFNRIRGYIDTVKVELPPTTQEVEAMPPELEGFEFQDVQIVMNLNTNIGVPFYIDFFIEGLNPEGEKAAITPPTKVISPDIPASKRIVIKNAENLININPNKLIAHGSIKIFGEGEVAADQYLEGTINLNIPLIIEFQENASLDMNYQLINEKDSEINDNLETMKLHYSIINDFDFGTRAKILAAGDTNSFNDQTGTYLDTLIESINIAPKASIQDSILLSKNQINLFNDSLYIKPELEIQGLPDQPSKIATDDSLKLSLWGTAVGKIDKNLTE